MSGIDIDTFTQYNPDVDEIMGHRALLHDGTFGNEDWDQLIDSLVSGILPRSSKTKIKYRRLTTNKAVNLKAVMFYTFDCRPSLLAAAARAGFFCFGVECQYPDLDLVDRGVLNLELAGRARKSSSSCDHGGRILLSDVATLRVGSKSVKACKQPPNNVKYRLTVNTSFERVWSICVLRHGADWCGFRNIRQAYHDLYERPQNGVKMVSVELWANDDTLASGEIGYIVGSAYTCLTLFSDTHIYPRCDQIRTHLSILWLHKAGVRLFDVGTTANYYVTMYNFYKTTRREFVAQWRDFRDIPLANPNVLDAACTDPLSIMIAHRNDHHSIPHGQEKDTVPPDNTKYVAHISSSAISDDLTISELDIIESLKPYGDVKQVKILKKSPCSGTPALLAIVHFCDHEGLSSAIASAEITIGKMLLNITPASTKAKLTKKRKREME